jgi:hypothetical protein
MGNVTLAGATSGQITLAPTAVAGTNTLTLPASTGTVALTASPTFTGTTTVSNLTLAAGTASLAPEVFTSGTNLTSAIAGAVEYDGKVFYATPQGTQRGVIPGQQFYRLNANLAGADAATAQSTFGVGVTLSASTVYAFECLYILSKTAGATSHTVAMGFGGTATINNIIAFHLNREFGSSLPIANNTTTNNAVTNTATSLVLTGAITNATEQVYGRIQGTVSVNAAGTFIPQYTLSAAPGGAYSTLAGSYFYIYPLGAAGLINVGAWA